MGGDSFETTGSRKLDAGGLNMLGKSSARVSRDRLAPITSGRVVSTRGNRVGVMRPASSLNTAGCNPEPAGGHASPRGPDRRRSEWFETRHPVSYRKPGVRQNALKTAFEMPFGRCYLNSCDDGRCLQFGWTC